MKITAIVPLKKDSQRIHQKNRRQFNGVPLFTIILQTLQSCNNIGNIIVNSDCPDMRNHVVANFSKAIVVERPIHLLGGHISGNDLIEYDLHRGPSNHFFQTHCTNPLLTETTINKAISIYLNSLETHDSMLSVSPIMARLYKSDMSPYNHMKGEMLRTQDMDIVYKENSSFFIFSRESFLNAGKNRIGLKPLVFEMGTVESVDIDYEEDFLLAEMIHRNKSSFPGIFGPT